MFWSMTAALFWILAPLPARPLAPGLECANALKGVRLLQEVHFQRQGHFAPSAGDLQKALGIRTFPAGLAHCSEWRLLPQRTEWIVLARAREWGEEPCLIRLHPAGEPEFEGACPLTFAIQRP